MKIIERAVFSQIIQYLGSDNIIVLHGARQVGKTHILYFLEDYLKKNNKNVLYFDLEDVRLKSDLDRGVDYFLQILKEKGFDLKSENYVLIDEIQYLKDPSTFLKIIADHHKKIKLIVSGSSSFAIKSKFKDSLVGRTVDFEIFPLSFEEFLRFKNYSIDLKIIKEKVSSLGLQELSELFREYVLYGGYPKIVLEPDLQKKEKYLSQIISTYILRDIGDLGKIRDLEKFNKLVETLASQSGQQLNIAELSNTCRLSRPTLENYLFILENTYIIKLLRPYYKNIRSELFKSPKIYFYDTGIMQILWLKQMQKEILGSVLETAIFSELVKTNSVNDIFYWRTADGKEIDFILKVKEKILPIEVKLNFHNFDDTAMKYFCKNYKIENWRVVSLLGEKKSENFIYPWQM